MLNISSAKTAWFNPFSAINYWEDLIQRDIVENEGYRVTLTFRRDNTAIDTYKIVFSTSPVSWVFYNMFDRPGLSDWIYDSSTNHGEFNVIFEDTATTAQVEIYLYIYPDNSGYGTQIIQFDSYDDVMNEMNLEFNLLDLRVLLGQTPYLDFSNLKDYLTYNDNTPDLDIILNGIYGSLDMPYYIMKKLGYHDHDDVRNLLYRYICLDYYTEPYLDVTHTDYFHEDDGTLTVLTSITTIFNVKDNALLFTDAGWGLDFKLYYGEETPDGTLLDIDYTQQPNIFSWMVPSYPDLHNITAIIRNKIALAPGLKSDQNYLFWDNDYQQEITFDINPYGVGVYSDEVDILFMTQILSQTAGTPYYYRWLDELTLLKDTPEVYTTPVFTIPIRETFVRADNEFVFWSTIEYPSELQPSIDQQTIIYLIDQNECFNVVPLLDKHVLYRDVDGTIDPVHNINLTINRSNLPYVPGFDYLDTDLTDLDLTLTGPGLDFTITGFPMPFSDLYGLKIYNWNETATVISPIDLDGVLTACVTDNYFNECGTQNYQIRVISDIYEYISSINLVGVGGNSVVKISQINYPTQLVVQFKQPITPDIWDSWGDDVTLRFKIMISTDLVHIYKDNQFDDFVLTEFQDEQFYTVEWSHRDDTGTIDELVFNLGFVYDLKCNKINKFVNAADLISCGDGNILSETLCPDILGDLTPLLYNTLNNNMITVGACDEDNEFIHMDTILSTIFYNIVHCNFAGFGSLGVSFIYIPTYNIYIKLNYITFHTSNYLYRLTTVDSWLGKDEDIVELNYKYWNNIVQRTGKSKEINYDLEYNPYYMDNQMNRNNNYVKMRNNFQDLSTDLKQVLPGNIFNDYLSTYTNFTDKIKSIDNKFGILDNMALTVKLEALTQISSKTAQVTYLNTNMFTANNAVTVFLIVPGALHQTFECIHSTNPSKNIYFEFDSNDSTINLINLNTGKVISLNDPTLNFNVVTENLQKVIDGNYSINGINPLRIYVFNEM